MSGDESWSGFGPAWTWADAERLAAAHMRALGLEDARTTGPGADQGVDVVSAVAAAQVKHQVAKVGRPAVQRLVGATQDVPHRLFYARGYSAAAVAYAEQMAVALFTFDELGVVRPVTLPARLLVAGQVDGLHDAGTRMRLARLRREHEQASAWDRRIAAVTAQLHVVNERVRLTRRLARSSPRRQAKKLERTLAKVHPHLARFNTASAKLDRLRGHPAGKAMLRRDAALSAMERELRAAARVLGLPPE